MTLSRRVFTLLPLGAGLVAASQAQAPLLDEKSDAAKAQGYLADAKKVDKAKWPKYAAGQLCSNCALYQGKPADKAAACPLFSGKQVAGAGWCNAWVKRS